MDLLQEHLLFPERSDNLVLGLVPERNFCNQRFVGLVEFLCPNKNFLLQFVAGTDQGFLVAFPFRDIMKEGNELPAVPVSSNNTDFDIEETAVFPAGTVFRTGLRLCG